MGTESAEGLEMGFGRVVSDREARLRRVGLRFGVRVVNGLDGGGVVERVRKPLRVGVSAFDCVMRFGDLKVLGVKIGLDGFLRMR